MATEHGIAWPVLAAAALSAPTGAASFAATALSIPLLEYGFATGMAALGIIGRHGWEAKVKGSFDVKGLIFDILTAPMLGIMIYIGCQWWGADASAAPFFILFFSLLGPGWFIKFGSQVAEVLAERLRNKT